MVQGSKQHDIKYNRYDESNFITYDYVQGLITQSNDQCYYCDVQLQYIDFSADLGTIERIDNSLGHIMGNCVIACRTCNYSKVGAVNGLEENLGEEYTMLQPTSTKSKSNRREPKQSKKPRVTELVVDERVTIPVESELIEEPICLPIEKPTPDPEPTIEETTIEETKEPEPKTQCPCGSHITQKSLSKHYSTKKHTSWLLSQEATTITL
jgi:hypothetical protein